MWKGVNVDTWTREWGLYERIRRRWATNRIGELAVPDRRTGPVRLILSRYLAPFIVLEQFRGQGIGRLLCNMRLARLMPRARRHLFISRPYPMQGRSISTSDLYQEKEQGERLCWFDEALSRRHKPQVDSGKCGSSAVSK